MGGWIEATEAKARIIHQELQSARELARRMGKEPEEITGPYLEMLGKLYREDFSYALLAENADLIARYRGPGVAHREPPVSLVTTVFKELRGQGRLKVSLIPLQRLDPAPAEHPVDVVGHGHQSSPDGAEAIGPQQVEAQGAQ
jgi:hypothetical protein